jgi:hypothetical protein
VREMEIHGLLSLIVSFADIVDGFTCRGKAASVLAMFSYIAEVQRRFLAY